MNEVAVLLAEGCEEVEAITPIDFLRRAALPVTVVGVTGRSVTGSHGISIQADVELSSYRQKPRAVVIPGGMPGAQNISDSEPAVRLIKEVAESGGLVAAICAAPAVVLARHGLLAGKRATCYPGYQDRLSGADFSEERVVVDGKLITSRGPGTAAEFSAAIIDYLAGRESAEKVNQATLQK